MNNNKVSLDEALKIFGIGYAPTKSMLKKKYRELTYKYHPDSNTNSKKDDMLTKADMMVRVNLAYEVLEGYAKEDNGADTGLDFGDILLPEKVRDNLKVYKTCSSCEGRGKVKVEIPDIGICPFCHGEITQTYNNYARYLNLKFYYTVVFKTCDDCGGTGQFELKWGARKGEKVKCKNCNGHGWNEQRCTHCGGTGYVRQVAHSYWKICDRCQGQCEVPLDLWNPVLVPGALNLNKQKRR